MKKDLAELQRQLALSAYLLGYPDASWRALRPEARAALSELEDPRAARCLAAFLDGSCEADPRAFEERYVNAFDFGKDTSLCLTGQSASDELQQRMGILSYALLFEECGYSCSDGTPDYLPALLELAAHAKGEQAARVLSAARDDMALLEGALEREGLDDYAEVVGLAVAGADALAGKEAA